MMWPMERTENSLLAHSASSSEKQKAIVRTSEKQNAVKYPSPLGVFVDDDFLRSASTFVFLLVEVLTILCAKALPLLMNKI